MFIDSTQFPFTKELEDKWEVIRDEFQSLPNESFDPWVQQSMHGTGWSVYGFYAMGNRIDEACDKCPETAKILQKIAGLSLAGFSLLAPKTHIKPHVGWAESVYRLHLGLVVPPECALRVADTTRNWEAGKCLIFDDTVEHEAWNKSGEYRGTLMLDFLRPGVTDFSEDMIPEEVRKYAEALIEK